MRGCAALAILALLFGAPAAAGEAEETRRLNELALDLMLAGQARVTAVADRIRIAGAAFCGGNVVPVFGAFAADRTTFDDLFQDKDFVKPFLETAAERFRLVAEPRLLLVAPGLPAAQAGLEAGDRVLAIDGREIERRVHLDVLRKHGESGSVALEIERDGERRARAVEARMGCAFPARFFPGLEINAYAVSFGLVSGTYFFSGLLRYLPGDDQLAVVAGHELAHHILGHTNQPRTFERTEAEADYLGLYLAARAGYDLGVAPEVWDDFARISPFAAVDWGFYSHPLSAKRSLELRAAIAEIQAKQARGAPLEPERNRFSLDRPEPGSAEVEAHLEALRDESRAIFRGHQARIEDVVYHLAKHGASVCGEKRSPLLGAALSRAQDFSRSRGDDVERAFGVGKDVTVVHVAEGSPAQRAGLRVGDRLHQVDGEGIHRTTDVYDALRASEPDPIVLRVRRGGEELALSLPRELGCGFAAFVTPKEGVTTESHRNRLDMQIPIGLARFAGDDDELAIAIAHQMGHQLLGKGIGNAKYEPEADRLGLRIAAAAGYDVGRAARFWDGWAAEQFWTISPDMDDLDIAHGAVALRAPVVRETVAALRAEPEANAGALREDLPGAGATR
jgi:membrane-associated protease RseP (regulator of RpoE activity)